MPSRKSSNVSRIETRTESVTKYIARVQTSLNYSRKTIYKQTIRSSTFGAACVKSILTRNFHCCSSLARFHSS